MKFVLRIFSIISSRTDVSKVLVASLKSVGVAKMTKSNDSEPKTTVVVKKSMDDEEPESYSGSSFAAYHPDKHVEKNFHIFKKLHKGW